MIRTMDSKMRILICGAFLLTLAVNSVTGDFSLMQFGQVTGTVDTEHEQFEKHGVSCLDVSYPSGEPYWVNAGEYSISELGATDPTDVIILISPNNVGFSRTYKNALLSFLHETNGGAQICVKVESHLGNGESLNTPSTGGYKIDWIVGSASNLQGPDIDVLHQALDSYGCQQMHLSTSSSDKSSDPVVVVSLKHPLSNEASTILHYDTVWTRRVLPERLSVCWADSTINEADHSSVDIVAVAVQNYNVSQPTVSYIASKIEFDWPAEANGFCLSIPLVPYHEIVPLVFVSLENDGSSGNELDDAEGAFVWVENAGSASLEVCGSIVGGTISRTIAGGTKMKLHYILIERSLSPTEETAHIKVNVTQHCKYSYGSDSACKYDAYWNGADDLSTDTQLILQFFRELLGENGDDLSVEFTDEYRNYSEDSTIATYYFAWSSPDPDGDVQQLIAVLAAASEDKVGMLNYENTLWQDYLEITKYSDDGPTEYADVKILLYGVECKQHYNLGACSSTSCSEAGGTVTATPRIDKYDPLGVTHCQITPLQLACNQGPCEATYTITPLVQSGEQLINNGEPIDLEKIPLSPIVPPSPPDIDPNVNGDPSSSVSADNTGLVAAAAVLGCVLLVGIAGFIWYLTSKKRSSFSY